MVDSTANSIVVEDLTGDLETVRWTGEKAELCGAAGLGVYGAATGTNRLGQYYCWNRTYDVNTGRWTTPDSVATPWWNLGVTPHCNGVKGVDTSGLSGGFVNAEGQWFSPWDVNDPGQIWAEDKEFWQRLMNEFAERGDLEGRDLARAGIKGAMARERERERDSGAGCGDC